jgi:hypothetical protein
MARKACHLRVLVRDFKSELECEAATTFAATNLDEAESVWSRLLLASSATSVASARASAGFSTTIAVAVAVVVATETA